VLTTIGQSFSVYEDQNHFGKDVLLVICIAVVCKVLYVGIMIAKANQSTKIVPR
jgi:hypothetical protein